MCVVLKNFVRFALLQAIKMPTYVKAPLWNSLAAEAQNAPPAFVNFKQFWQRCVLRVFCEMLVCDCAE